MDAPNFTRPQLTALIAPTLLCIWIQVRIPDLLGKFMSVEEPDFTWIHSAPPTWWECDGLGHRAEGIVRHGQGNQSKGLSCMTVPIIFSPGLDHYLHSSWISNYHNAKLYFSVISLQKMRLAIMSEIILLGDQLFWNCIAVTCLSLCLQGTSLCWMHPPPVHSLDLIFPGK